MILWVLCNYFNILLRVPGLCIKKARISRVRRGCDVHLLGYANDQGDGNNDDDDDDDVIHSSI